jgi:hypothetical protein
VTGTEVMKATLFGVYPTTTIGGFFLGNLIYYSDSLSPATKVKQPFM